MKSKTINILIKCLFGLIFIIVIAPLGFLLRMCGADFMAKKTDYRISSYWKKKQNTQGVI